MTPATLTRRALVGGVLLITASVAAEGKSPEIYTAFLSSAAIGYDAVAYFTEGKPVAGKSGITHTLERRHVALFLGKQP